MKSGPASALSQPSVCFRTSKKTYKKGPNLKKKRKIKLEDPYYVKIQVSYCFGEEIYLLPSCINTTSLYTIL